MRSGCNIKALEPSRRQYVPSMPPPWELPACAALYGAWCEWAMVQKPAKIRRHSDHPFFTYTSSSSHHAAPWWMAPRQGFYYSHYMGFWLRAVILSQDSIVWKNLLEGLPSKLWMPYIHQYYQIKVARNPKIWGFQEKNKFKPSSRSKIIILSFTTSTSYCQLNLAYQAY